MMPINADKTHLWKADAAQSIDFYNGRFSRFATPSFEKADTLEMRQYAILKRWLLRRGYKQIASDECSSLDAMSAGSFSFCHTSSTGKKKTSVDIPTYCVVKPTNAGKKHPPLIIEAKSSKSISSSVRCAKKDARDFAAFKEQQEKNVKFMLLLCGYFDGYYLGPQAADGTDWVWQHRLDDLGSILVKGNKKRPESMNH